MALREVYCGFRAKHRYITESKCRRGSTLVSTVLQKSVRVFITKYIFHEIKLSKLKSGQYPDWMTQKPRKGDLREKNPKNFTGVHASGPH